MNAAILDIKALVADIVANVGPENVKNEMESNYGWIKIDPNDIPGDVASFFNEDVDPDEFDAMLEVVYSEFYNIAAAFDYNITMFD